MNEYSFKNVMTTNMITIEARTFGEAIGLLRKSTKHIEDYFCTNDKMKVLS